MTKTTNRAVPLALLTLGFAGIAVFVIATARGIGITTDSTAYIWAARSLSQSQGLSCGLSASGELLPMIHYPPLFPAILGILAYTGIDPLHGARWLNAFLFGANILLVGLVVWHHTRSRWISILGSFIMLTSTLMLGLHTVAKTEPLFFFFILLGWLLLAAHAANPNRTLLLLTSIVAGLAFLARFPGLALVATGIVSMMFWNKRPVRQRVADSAVFVAISCLPMALWLARNLQVSGQATTVQLAFHPVTLHHLDSGLTDISDWLLPASVPTKIRMIVFLVAIGALLGAGAVLWFRKRKLHESRSLREDLGDISCILAAFGLFYGLFVTAAISFGYADIPLNDRNLSPLFISGLLLVLCLGHRLLYSTEGLLVPKLGAAAIGIALAISYLVGEATWVAHTRKEGQGFTGRAWQQSEVVEAVRELPPDTPIFTNAVGAIYILTGKAAREVPAAVVLATGRPNPAYRSELADVEVELRNKGGALVYFRDEDNVPYPPSERELKGRLPLELLSSSRGGSVYTVAR